MGAAILLAAAVLLASSAVSSVTSPYLTLQWTRWGTSPVLTSGSAGSWDRAYVVAGPVVLVSGTYHMFYTGSADGSTWSIGHATSLDGIHWTKDPRNPVIPFAESPAVLYESGEFKMWVDNPSQNAVEYYVSPDGTAWTLAVGNPVLLPGPGWDADHSIPGAVVHDATGYYLYYEGVSGIINQVGLATSLDGITWTKSPANPVIPAGGPWYSTFLAPCSVLDAGSVQVLWFVGGNTTNYWHLGVAVSTDGTNWTVSKQTALDPDSGQWDGVSLSRASVVQIGGVLDMWYTGGSGYDFEVGLATSPAPAPSSGSGPSGSGALILDPLTLLLALVLIVGVAVAIFAVAALRVSKK